MIRKSREKPVAQESIEILLQESKVALFQDPIGTSAGDHFDQTLRLSSFLYLTFLLLQPF